MKKIIAVIVIISFILPVLHYYEKTPIEEATIEQLMLVDGIGEKLSVRIFDYKETISSIDDLRFDSVTGKGVKYVGKIRLRKLKQRFR